jgi:hypothetical protein
LLSEAFFRDGQRKGQERSSMLRRFNRQRCAAYRFET